MNTTQQPTNGDERQEQTMRLAIAADENVMPLVYGPDFADELAGLMQSKKQFDLVVVDCRKCGYLFPAEIVIDVATAAKKLLTLQGAMVLAKSDKCVAWIKDTVIGNLSMHIFDAFADIYDYSPSLARNIQQALGMGLEQDRGIDLSEHILLSSIPVLTSFGIKLKAGMESVSRRNTVLSCVDNYTPVASILDRLEGKLTFEELLEDLRSLEETGSIYPLLPKIPFLVHCFRNRIAFKLKDYLVESRMVTPDQFDNILFAMQNTKGTEKLGLGSMCVSKGLISSRQLEIALKDQSLYGQTGDTDKVKLHSMTGETAIEQSIVGHLGTTDPAGLLQSLNSNRETGVLSVEAKDMQFRALFDQGKLSHARLGKLRGANAVIEFVSVWKEGIYVFIKRQPPPDLTEESCKLTRELHKMLMDSALASDNIETVWRKLPKGSNTPLEKRADPAEVLKRGPLVDPQENTPLTEDDLQMMQRLLKELDALQTIAGTIKRMGDITTIAAAQAVNRLLHYGLVAVPNMDLTGPLEKYQSIVSAVAKHIGPERSSALLRLSLQASQGYSAKARMFVIGSGGEVGVDLNMARMAGLSLSHVIKELEEWQVKYIEYVSQELDKNVLRDIVYPLYKR